LPIDVFELFFSADLQEEIVRESNRYAKQVMGDQQYQSWTPITVEELKAFFGFSILMGVNHLPSLDPTHNVTSRPYTQYARFQSLLPPSTIYAGNEVSNH
jgi:hypothetical protein